MQDPPTSEENNAAIIKVINEANRDLLWIGMKDNVTKSRESVVWGKRNKMFNIKT